MKTPSLFYCFAVLLFFTACKKEEKTDYAVCRIAGGTPLQVVPNASVRWGTLEWNGYFTYFSVLGDTVADANGVFSIPLTEAVKAKSGLRFYVAGDYVWNPYEYLGFNPTTYYSRTIAELETNSETLLTVVLYGWLTVRYVDSGEKSCLRVYSIDDAPNAIDYYETCGENVLEIIRKRPENKVETLHFWTSDASTGLDNFTEHSQTVTVTGRQNTVVEINY